MVAHIVMSNCCQYLNGRNSMVRGTQISRWWGLAGTLLSLCTIAAPAPGEADRLFQAQKWQASVDAYSDLVRQEPLNADYRFRLGRSYLELQQYPAAIEHLARVPGLESSQQIKNRSLYSLARAHAGAGNREGAIQSIQALADAGARIYAAMTSAPEIEELVDLPEFAVVLERLKPCAGEENHGFNFWIGDWTVTSPGREGWSADSSITQQNDGCSIHEAYSSLGGYTGSSINFYDQNDKKWHQTWIDNQGAALYLEGGVVDGDMVLSDGTNRITWSEQPDGRVRQHWETTPDEGRTWTTAFDGYYARKQGRITQL
jgi:tetratricopeptide (TPR) repeat protein